MPGSPFTVQYQENFLPVSGRLPVEVSPRLIVVGTFNAGRSGLVPLPAGFLRPLESILEEYSNGVADYETDYIKTYMRMGEAGVSSGVVEVYNVVNPSSLKAQTPIVTDGAGTPVNQFRFEAIGTGIAYNGLIIKLTCRRVIAAGHPAGANTSVFDVEVSSVNPDAAKRTFRNVVFTRAGGNGTSAYHGTIDAADAINDPLTGSLVARLVYEPTANSGYKPAANVVNNLTMTGGTTVAPTDAHWQAGIDVAAGLPFRWHVTPVPPNETIRAYHVAASARAMFPLHIVDSFYGETLSAWLTARATYGDDPSAGRFAPFYGWGIHANSDGREVPVSAAYMGKYSAKLNSMGLSGGYPVGNRPLGFRSIAPSMVLDASSQAALAAINTNYLKQLESGSYGVHGYWTGDNQILRTGDLGIRVMWNAVMRDMAEAVRDLAQNVGNTPYTREAIAQIVLAQLSKYFVAGMIEEANQGVFTYEEVTQQFQNVSLPLLEGWAYVLTRIRFNPTLGGVYLYFTNAEVKGLPSIFGSSGGASAASGTEEEGAE